MEPIDIWRSAKAIVDQHGDRAPLECALKADAFLEDGDAEGRLSRHRASSEHASLTEQLVSPSHLERVSRFIVACFGPSESRF